MILKVFSVYDGKVRAFMRPFMDQHTGNALRSFEEACKEPTSPFSKFASDFVLYEIGVFDDEQGRLIPHATNVQMAAAIDFVRSDLKAVSNV